MMFKEIEQVVARADKNDVSSFFGMTKNVEANKLHKVLKAWGEDDFIRELGKEAAKKASSVPFAKDGKWNVTTEVGESDISKDKGSRVAVIRAIAEAKRVAKNGEPVRLTVRSPEGELKEFNY